jgi:hypothetical protein
MVAARRTLALAHRGARERYVAHVHTATFISWALFTSTPSTQPSFDVADVVVDHGQNATVILAHDEDGEVVAEIVVWQDDAGAARLDVNFADALAQLSVTNDGETTTRRVDNEPLVAERLLLIQDALAETAADAEWVPCAASALHAVIDCVGLRPILCGIATFVATCECLDWAVEGDTSCWD